MTEKSVIIMDRKKKARHGCVYIGQVTFDFALNDFFLMNDYLDAFISWEGPVTNTEEVLSHEKELMLASSCIYSH